MTANWISPLVPRAPRSAYTYRAVGRRLRVLADVAVQPGERQDLKASAERWITAARRKAWSDNRRVPE